MEILPKCYLINQKGEKVLKDAYNIIEFIPELDGIYITKKDVGGTYFNPEYEYRVLNKEGKDIFNAAFKSAYKSGKVIILGKESYLGTMKYGVANSNSEFIVPMINDKVSFIDGISCLKTNVGNTEKYGFLKNSGEVLIPFDYKDAGRNGSKPEILWVKTFEDKYFLYDAEGKLIENTSLDDYGKLDEKGLFIKVKKNGKWGAIKEKKYKIPCEYDEIWETTKPDKFILRKDGKAGIIDSSGNMAIPIKYIVIQDMKENMFLAHNGNGFGLIDSRGTEIYPVGSASEIYEFKNGLARIKRNDLFGFINKKGEEIVPCKYTKAPDFIGGKADVTLGSEYKGCIDTMGVQTCENEIEKEIAKEKEKKDILDRFFPYQYSDNYCNLRLSKEPSKKDWQNYDYGSRRYVYSADIISGYMVGCILEYVDYFSNQLKLAKDQGTTLVDSHRKALLQQMGVSMESSQDYYFKGLYKGKKYTYSKNSTMCTVVEFQKDKVVYSITLMGNNAYFEDTIFELFMQTFEFK